MTFEEKVEKIEEILETYKPGDDPRELVALICDAYSDCVDQTASGYNVDRIEWAGHFWAWFCNSYPFERYDPRKGNFTSWFQSCCRRRFSSYIALIRRSFPEMPFLMDA